MSILDLFKLDGRVALVTGASRGLGQAMAVGLAQAGADVAGLDYTPDCAETQARVEALGRRFLTLSVDLRQSSQAALQAVVAQVTAGLGRLDILVNNAGIIRRAPARTSASRTGTTCWRSTCARSSSSPRRPGR
jgi:2-deoxy-D-gluconate 3-dehydrogenase